MAWWHPEKFMLKKQHLETRARVMRGIRGFFEARGYLEVETPALQKSPCMEPHIQAFRTDWISPDRKERKTLYLHTSPEFAMKKLLVAGAPKIFQLARTFRNEPPSRLHSPEFTLLEWYQAGMGYKEMMQETIDLLRTVCPDVLRWEEKTADPHKEWQILSVTDAMMQYAGVDIVPVLEDVGAFRAAAEKAGIKTGETDGWDDIFFRIFLDKVEPHLGAPVPTIIYDYPVSMAALAQPKPEDPRFAERFEIYACGMELCNAFGELTDGEAQRARFEHDVALRQKLYGDEYPVDEDFLKAIDFGMPPSSGNALGVDRLVMLISGADDIAQVQAVPVDLSGQGSYRDD